MDSKLNHYREYNTANLKIYSQLAHLKRNRNWFFLFFFFFFLRFHENVSDIVNITICKVKNSIISILKVGKLGWIEYIDKDIFTAFPGFHLEHKVNKYIQMFSKVYCFLALALSLLADHVSESTQSKFSNNIMVSR